MPGIRALVWFNRVKEHDWRVNSSTSAKIAFRSLVNSSLFRGSAETFLEHIPATRP
jgi:hypothetical protein